MPSPPTERVVGVLRLLAARPQEGRTLTEIAGQLGMNKVTCRSVLLALVDEGWLVRRSDRTFHLGPGLVALGRAAEDVFPAAHVAREHVTALAGILGCECSVTVADGESITIIEWASPPGERRPGLRGHRVPYMPPFGALQAAYRTRAETQAWLDRTPGGSAERRVHFAQMLDDIRARGCSIERESPAGSRLREVLVAVGGEPLSLSVRRLVDELIAELGDVEFLAAELRPGQRHHITRIAVPVFDRDGLARMSLAALVQRELEYDEVFAVVDRLRESSAAMSAGRHV
jgi:DNA-binding IclR family transcriptional regulator